MTPQEAMPLQNCIQLHIKQQQQQTTKLNSSKLSTKPRAAIRALLHQHQQTKQQLVLTPANDTKDRADIETNTGTGTMHKAPPSSTTHLTMSSPTNISNKNNNNSTSDKTNSTTINNNTIAGDYKNNSNNNTMLSIATADGALATCSLHKQCTTTTTTAVLQSNNASRHDQPPQQQKQQQQPNITRSLHRHYCKRSNFSYSRLVEGIVRRRVCCSFGDSIRFCYVQLLSLLLLLISEHLPSASASTNLLGKHEPMFISRSETFKFVAGDTIVLPCEVANTDPYVVAWKRGIAILTAGSVKVTPDPRVRLVNGFNLQIRDAVPQDAGDYICQIATMEPREITHTVEILVPPRIHHISTGGHLQVKKGSSVRIECSASGNPTPNVTWSRKNNILPNGEEKLHSHTLSIENVDRHKGGVYICTANNGVGQPASSQVVLHVLYPPEISVERPIVFSGEGHEAMLVCIVHGETQPEVIWFKDTMQLDTTERHIMETRGSRHTLIIRKVHPQDFGNYSCVAENQLGKSRKTLQLSGKPNVAVFNSPPISQYKDRYNISWTVDSHTSIEEYKLSFRRLPQGHEVDNSIDTHSPGSSTSLLQMYGGGGGIGAGGGLLGGNHNHRIGGLGNGGGGGLGSYGNVMHWGRNDWRDVVLPAIPLSHHYTQGMSYMIRGLDPDQQYEATVQARNRYGWSDLTHSFVFSTSSNDNEMRELSVTFYNSGASKTPPFSYWLSSLGIILVLIKLKFMLV